jgi:uncharacterized protein YxeA
MKKLLAALFTALMAITLALPVFAQDQGATSTDQSATQGTKKSKKAKKAKKSKKMDQSGSSTTTPQQ